VKTIRTIAAELYGLFVDDGRFALVILVWLAVCWLVLPRLLSPAWLGIVLVSGLLAALAESTWRRARG